MTSTLIGRIKGMFTTGHERSIRAKKNIMLSFFLQALSVAISFIIVPLTLHFLDIDRYGIWLTLSSVITWFGFFDIGLGNGLRNKLSEAFALNDMKLARIYVSTTYALVLIIITSLFLLFLVFFNVINWVEVFNAPAGLEEELKKAVFFVFCFFCLQFIFNLITVVLNADQKPAINDVFRVISSCITLGIVFLLTKSVHASLFYFPFAFTGITFLVLMTGNIVLFSTKYKAIAPSIRFVRFKYVSGLFSLGFSFFIIQISSIVLFSTDNIIITQLFGPAEVAPYNIAYKYFGIITLSFAIINTPFWSAYTEAYAKSDFAWIIQINRHLKKAWGVLSLGSVVLLFISPLLYHYWIGDSLKIPFILSLSMCLYVIIINWGTIFVYFINGVGKIKLQFYISIIAAIVNIPLSVYLAKGLHWGTPGVIIATIVCLSFGPLIAPFQYKKLIKKTAKGIWNK